MDTAQESNFLVPMSNELAVKINEANSYIKEAFKRFGNQICFCFNGGKDSVVLFDLVYRYSKEHNFSIIPFYLETDTDFVEILKFIDEFESIYGINIMRIKTSNLKDGLQILVDDYHVQATFLGVRASDYRTDLNVFEATSAGWPAAIRVMPLLNWSYHDVWMYIDMNELPYCGLYKLGYTSLGSRFDTKQNPLLYDNTTGTYRHARDLQDQSQERLGRAPKK